MSRRRNVMLCSSPQSAIIPFDERVDKNVTSIITRFAHAVVFVKLPCVRFVLKRVKERLILIPFSLVRSLSRLEYLRDGKECPVIIRTTKSL